MVRVKRLSADSSQLLDPSAPEWLPVPRETLLLAPTPLAAQPSLYVQASWAERPYGATREVAVQAGHNGSAIFFRLEWADETKDAGIDDTDRFTDAAAVLFPVRGDAPLLSMGSAEFPVNGWYWRPDQEAPVSVTAQGLGTTVRNANGGISARSSYDRGWSVVISRQMWAEKADIVALHAGQQGKVGFAVWQGSNRERGGLKAVTLEWQPLEIEG